MFVSDEDELNKFRLFVMLSSNESGIEDAFLQGFNDFSNQIGFNTVSGLLKTLDLIKYVNGSIDYLNQDYGIDVDRIFFDVLEKDSRVTSNIEYKDFICRYLHHLSPFSIKRFYQEKKIDDTQLCHLIKSVDFTDELRLVRNDFRVMFLKSLYEIPNISSKVKKLIEDELSLFNTTI